jgi:DNA-binding transcriptional LysR family regulator
MELRHLQSFVVLAEELHFGRAAERQHIVQPALSKQIALLERELGVKLFDRNRRVVELTAAGKIFLPRAQQVLGDAREAAELARQAGAGAVGSLGVGFIAPACLYQVPAMLRVHRERYPAVGIRLVEAGTAQLVAKLQQQQIDIAFCRGSHEVPTNLQVHSSSEDSVVLALPEDHDLARMTKIPFTALQGVPILMISSQTDSENVGHYLAMAAEAGISITIAHEVDQLHIALALATAGLGVTFMPAFAATMLPPGLVTRPITDPEPTIQTQVLIRRGRPAPLLRNLLESLDTALGAAPPSEI